MHPSARSVLNTIKAHEAELRRAGVDSLSLFGSIARGEDVPGSDIDFAVRFAPESQLSLLDVIGVRNRIADLLARPVDLIEEPTRKAWLQREIDRDRVRAF